MRDLATRSARSAWIRGIATLSLTVSLLAGMAQPMFAGEASQALKPVDAAAVHDVVNNHDGPVLVNFWATWCQPCREEMPDLIQLRREFHERGFELILVSADFTRASDKAAQYLADQGVTWPAYIKNQSDNEFINAIDPDWSGALPYSVLYDEHGTAVHTWAGKLTHDDAARRISNLLSDQTR